MEQSKKIETCINCGKTEQDAPILQFKYKGSQLWICSGCMPVLIHHPEQLAGQQISINNIDLTSST